MRPVLLCALAAALPLSGAWGQEAEGRTPAVFRRYRDRVTRLQVVESGSAATVRVGSGFFVDDEGRLITNYHVIADVVHHPDRYRAELGDGSAPGDSVAIQAFDVAHDLALLQAAPRRRPHFTLAPVGVRQGDRLYALGHPHDLDLSIVEGTYNGLLRHTLYPKLHFTGSLNPGMSGGPTITADGRVVGINVSTAGNQVSFLVPVERAIALMERSAAKGHRPPDRPLDEVAAQLLAYQDAYVPDLLTDSTRAVELGPFRVATEPAPFFRCWGSAPAAADLPYERAEHHCSTDDELYIADNQRSGVVNLTHELITTTSLSPSRFYALYSSVFGRDNTPAGDEEHVTSWRCGTRNLARAATRMRAVLCLRAYRKLGGLYDGVVKVAVLGRRDAGLVSTLALSGVSFPNLERLTARFLEQIAWR